MANLMSLRLQTSASTGRFWGHEVGRAAEAAFANMPCLRVLSLRGGGSPARGLRIRSDSLKILDMNDLSKSDHTHAHIDLSLSVLQRSLV
mmetsp:Transcript_8975/g.21639  ORF Transcript_8975/g.21639 Transcript_8975/m.21639 type:complete len:90 (-) Transcript_8975:52-321(-)